MGPGALYTVLSPNVIGLSRGFRCAFGAGERNAQLFQHPRRVCAPRCKGSPSPAAVLIPMYVSNARDPLCPRPSDAVRMVMPGLQWPSPSRQGSHLLSAGARMQGLGPVACEEAAVQPSAGPTPQMGSGWLAQASRQLSAALRLCPSAWSPQAEGATPTLGRLQLLPFLKGVIAGGVGSTGQSQNLGRRSAGGTCPQPGIPGPPAAPPWRHPCRASLACAASWAREGWP